MSLCLGDALPVLFIHLSSDRAVRRQVEEGKLTDYEGTYARFLEKTESEAGKMAVKEQKKKELEKSQIKAKSKVGPSFKLSASQHSMKKSCACLAGSDYRAWLYLSVVRRPATFSLAWDHRADYCCGGEVQHVCA